MIIGIEPVVLGLVDDGLLEETRVVFLDLVGIDEGVTGDGGNTLESGPVLQ